MDPSVQKLPLKALAMSWLWAVVLILISTGVALSFNSLRDKGLSLFRRAPFDLYTDCPELSGELSEVTVKELPVGDKKVVYIDSRMALPFITEHIPGARFMPMYPIDLPDFTALKDLPKGTWIVVYGSKKLQNNKRLVTALMNQDIRGVYLLKGGLTAWKESGRKTEKLAIRYITADKVVAMSPLFVDAREEESFLEGQIKGAINIPLDSTLPPQKKLLVRLKKSTLPMVIYDSGKTPAEGEQPANGVYADLYARGVTNLYIVTGGIKALLGGGYVLVKEAKGEDEE